MKAERIEEFKAHRKEIAELAPLDEDRSLPETAGGERLYFPVCLEDPWGFAANQRSFDAGTRPAFRRKSSEMTG